MKRIKYIDSILIKNNISEIWADRKVRFRIIFIPLLISVIIPVVFLFIALLSEINFGVDVLRTLLPKSLTAYNNEQTVHYISVNVVSVMLFPIIPITVSSAACSACLIGEKENRTIFVLLTSPLSPSVIIRSKYISSALLSVIISFISSFCFFITASIGNIVFSTTFFFDSFWAITIFLLTPALSLLCALLITVLSPFLNNKEAALSSASFLIFSVIVFYMLEFTGLYRITSLTFFIITLCVYITDFVLLFVVDNCFKSEDFLDIKEN